MTIGFKKCNQITTISLSTHYLDHYTSFFISDGLDDNPDYFSFNQHMLQTINILLNVTKESGTPLKRWLSSTVVMIETIQNTTRVNKFYMINIYEVDYSVLLLFLSETFYQTFGSHK